MMTVDGNSLVRAMGKDWTLTGRTAIWTAVVERIDQRPLFGYGYDAFWSSASGPGEAVRNKRDRLSAHRIHTAGSLNSARPLALSAC